MSKSLETFYLFRPRDYDNRNSITIAGDETPQDALNCRMQLLQSVHSHKDNWRNVVARRDADNFCTRTKIANIRQRALFLCSAYQLALKIESVDVGRLLQGGMQTIEQPWNKPSNLLQDC
jgi:hypothetical protein